jgi:hypothetical protein
MSTTCSSHSYARIQKRQISFLDRLDRALGSSFDDRIFVDEIKSWQVGGKSSVYAIRCIVRVSTRGRERSASRRQCLAVSEPGYVLEIK